MAKRVRNRVEPHYAGSEFEPTIEIERSILPIAIRHGMELWWDDSTPKKRLDQRNGRSGFTRYVNARIEGKLSEVAFKQFLADYYGIESEVDWRIYGEYTQTDNGDLEYIVGDDGEHYPPSAEFDLKKTKPWNQWLAVRQSIFNQIDDDAPIILTKLSIQDDIVLDEWADTDDWETVDQDKRFRDRLLAFADDYFPLEVELIGTAYKHEFTDEFEQGQRLYDPNTGKSLGKPLKCDNQGIHVNDLHRSPERWNRVVYEIVSDVPVTMNPLLIVDP